LAGTVYVDPVHFEVTDHDVTDLVIKTTTGSSISGVVVFDGADEKAAPRRYNEFMIWLHSSMEAGSQIVVSGSQIGVSSPSAMVNADGTFTIAGLRPGVFRLSIYGPSRGPMGQLDISRIERDGVVQSRVEVKEREQIKGLRLIVRPRTGGIRGVVKFENGQMPPLSRIQTYLKRDGDEFGTSVQLDDRGRFISDGLAAGVYELVVTAYVSRRGMPPSVKQQVVVVDNQVTEVTITMDLKTDAGAARP
jgi:hypothetical protein